MDSILERAEARRVAALAALDPEAQRQLGQFFTPAPAAALIASLPAVDALPARMVRVLDPGAGSGSLTAALVDRLARERPGLAVHVVAVETDPAVIPALSETLADCERIEGVTTELVSGDFLAGSTGMDPDPRLLGPFDLVIMNPPYGKQPAGDHLRRSVAREHVDTPNLYSAFWALGVAALAPGGQCVAIVPRSWANGSYFAAFRRWLLDRVHLDALHVFESRSTVFADTGVLQENVIVSATRGAHGGPVTLSASVGHADEVTRQTVPASVVVQPEDPHMFVRFTDGAARVPAAARFTLAELGLTVSTGRVVDFRCRPYLSDDPNEPGTVPLIYPGNVRGGGVEWPREIRKAQAYRVAEEAARRWLLPAGNYALTKRFSAKEERRRVVAGVCSMGGPVALENHLNYFHERGGGLPLELARGLSVWLNSTAVDELFRTFSGHTQVNAGDLRTLPYPSREDLAQLGRELPGALPDQGAVDAVVSRVLDGVAAVAS
ncbi:Eco57I restriction-modification methylase domain-containing protein [Ornithinimicrobium sp. Y1694]|uniref:Eco57I restriction-modification methylase domain-containing protein n=1 Tax=Ornithinimicrobium sp. Y1694 TaxID=3418590 RepID=UPI003CE825C0